MQRFYLILFLLIFFQVKSQTTTKIRLIGGWEFFRGDLGGIWEVVRPAESGLPESIPVWDKVTLPHCFNATDAVDPDLKYYQGSGWYRTQLEINNPFTNGRTILHFEGAGQKTDVYVYTIKVGSHVGGYDEWSVDITGAIASLKNDEAFQKRFKGKIPVSIRCDNSRDLEMIPSNMSDFNVYGGIYRYLDLEYLPVVSLDKLFINTQLDKENKKGKVEMKIRFYNPLKSDSTKIEIKISDKKDKIVAKASSLIKLDSEDKLVFNTEIKNPLLWSPANPVLYNVEVKISSSSGTEIVNQKFGFRNFEFASKGPFYLNGQRLLLRGVHRHEDHAGVGAAMTEEMIRSEMVMIKEMGANFIRLGHYQQSPIVLNLCDSLGILVWEEIPWCRGGLGGDQYKNQAKRMLTNMIEQHFNHPSIILWGLGNENDWPGDFPEFDKQKIKTFMKELNDLAHSLDPYRKTSIRRCDFCKDIVDVYSPSIWAGWYRGKYMEYKTVSEKEFKKVDHFFHAEWGGDSHARRHSEDTDKMIDKIDTGKGADERKGDATLSGGSNRASKDGDWSETYICNLIDWHLKEQETMPWLTGSAYWTFKDFSTPLRPENPLPYVNQKGIVERNLNKKEAYYVFQSYWTEKPMVHIYGHTWPIRWGNDGEEKMVKIYSNCDEVELFLNSKSLGIKKRNSQDFPAAGLRWMAVFQKGDNSVKAIGKKGKEQITDEIHFKYQTEKWEKPEKLTIEKIAQEGNILTFQAQLTDKDGILCLDARNYVEFGLTGDGKLIDNQGTSDGSRKVQLYNGRAIIKVDAKGGENCISVKSEGIKTVFLKF